MNRKIGFILLSLVVGLVWVNGLRGGTLALSAAEVAVSASGIAAPVLKWQLGGCDGIWCETGWYSSPAVADLDNDGAPEVIGSTYSLYVLNGEDGSVQWEADPPGGRTWPGVVVADIDNNNDLEIALGQGDGYLTVYDHNGNQVWQRRQESNELRGLSAYDLDADGSLELIATATGDLINTYVYEHNGDLRPGWPQLDNDSGYGHGVYNANAAIGDLDADGQGELIVPSDVHYINAYEANGAQIPAHPMYDGDGWGKVGIWESLEVELRGWGLCDGDRAESYRTNFADGPAVIADVNGDGAVEVVTTGNVYDCQPGYVSKYIGVYIFNADRSRFNEDGFDWQTAPIDTGAPLAEDYNLIESALPNPILADLEGDGQMEILFASYDGRLHTYWLDKSEHHNWPYNVDATGPGIRFASEPAVADLDNDGFAEVIFTSWPQSENGYVGKLHILNYQGSVLHEMNLPAPSGNADWNGSLPAPTLANIDADADLELVLNTVHSGIVAYDLPGTADAHILWGTGRGNYQRTGSFLVGNLAASSFSAQPITPAAGQMVTYTIRLVNPGPALANASLTSTISADMTHVGTPTATSGTAVYAAGVVSWNGDVNGGEPVIIRYTATVNGDVTEPQAIWSQSQLDDGLGNLNILSALIIANGESLFLPVVQRP